MVYLEESWWNNRRLLGKPLIDTSSQEESASNGKEGYGFRGGPC